MTAMRWPILLLVVALLAASAGVLHAQGTGVIEGRVVNRTPDGESTGGSRVALGIFRDNAFVEERTAVADEDGRFRFEGLETSEAYTYRVGALYKNVPYRTEDAIRLTPEAPTVSIELSVYETTTSDPGLRVARAILMVEGFDRASQTISVLELLALENPGQHTYQPSATGPSGPMGLLRFALPAGAGALVPGLGLEEADVIQVDRGFGTTRPIPPGVTEIGFSYQVPYTGQGYRFERTVPYETGLLWLLIPDTGVRVAEEGAWGSAAPIALGERTYRVLTRENLAKGSRLDFSLQGLPRRGVLPVVLEAVPPPVWGVGLAGLALAAAASYAYAAEQRRRRQPEPSTQATEELLDALVELEEQQERGAIPVEEYHERRARYLEALIDHLTMTSERRGQA
jgi:hypothetical protein